MPRDSILHSRRRAVLDTIRRQHDDGGIGRRILRALTGVLVLAALVCLAAAVRMAGSL